MGGDDDLAKVLGLWFLLGRAHIGDCDSSSPCDLFVDLVNLVAKLSCVGDHPNLGLLKIAINPHD